MKRRDVLKSMGALAGAGAMSKLLPGCGADGQPPGIDHYVFLMMENRSYDHWFGARKMLEGLPGDGLVDTFTNKDLDGNDIALYAGVDGQLCVPDPAHGWDAAHIQFNDGAMDGFVTTQQMEHPGDTGPMQYLTRDILPVSWALADEYATCDRWFASVMGPTWPNRFYWLSGTSMGNTGNSIPDGGYTAPTIFGRMDAAGVDWNFYYSDLPYIALLGAHSDVDITDRLWTMEDFFHDCAKGKLKSVTYLDPAFNNADDHPPHHPVLGQAFIASVYKALSTSPQWERTLLVVTYDECGGFFDHVPPPKTADDRAADGFDQLGFRVPTLVIGPYVKQGYVSSVVRDHTSALKHIENNFGTEPLTMRSSAANDLSELIDTEALAKGAARAPIELPEVVIDDWMFDDPACSTTMGAVKDDLQLYADAHPELFARWDRRGEANEFLRMIVDRARR